MEAVYYPISDFGTMGPRTKCLSPRFSYLQETNPEINQAKASMSQPSNLLKTDFMDFRGSFWFITGIESM